MIGPIISTDNGAELVTQDGLALAINIPTVNGDIQLFDFSVDLLRALLWEYNDATNLQSILQQKQDWYNANQTQFWTDFYNNIFNLATADEFGLAIWSIILDIPLFVPQPPDPTDKPTFGFNNSYFTNFNRGGFSTRTGGATNLPLEIKRIALQLRYFQLCSSGTVPEINRFLNYVFANYGRVFLRDNHDMTQTYVFLFPVDSDLIYLFENFDLLPRPSGVGSTYADATRAAFGFGQFNLNFNRGTFKE